MWAESLGEAVLLPDTHAHLDADDFGEDCEAVVARAHAAGIDRILAVGSDLSSSVRAVELSRRFPAVYAAVGVHPHRAGTFEEDGEGVRALLCAAKVVAVGEIGLDFQRGVDENQIDVFRRQLEWAAKAGLPVSVHNRNADGEVMRLLRHSGLKAVLHCFSGTPEYAREALNAGFSVSFAGNLTFPRADTLRAVAASIPVDRLLVESDAPVLAPQPWRGRRNEPAYVAATASVLSEIRALPVDVLASRISRNANALFGWCGQ